MALLNKWLDQSVSLVTVRSIVYLLTKQLWRAESLQKFRWFFGGFEDTKRKFWNWLTFITIRRTMGIHWRVLLDCCTRNLEKIRNGILLSKLFWPTVRKNWSSDGEKLMKFEAEVQEFENFLRSLEQFIQTVKGQNNFW